MVPVRDDVVVLDVQSDRYACLVDVAGRLDVSDVGTVVAAPEILTALETEGLVDLSATPIARRAPVPVRRDLVAPMSAYGPLKALDTALQALTATARFRTRSLSRLTAPPRMRRRRSDARDPQRMAARAAAYCAVLPFLPFEGVCLQRTWQLREVLAADGLRPDWVFGVRTWPFFAHCWLQQGDCVVADRIEHVRAFTPIAVF